MANLTSRISLAPSPYELSRDIYGFAIRPHHLNLYKQFAEIYKEEEAERSARWEEFLSTYGDSAKNTDAHDALVSTSTEDGHKKEKEGSREFETWCEICPNLEPVERALQHRFKKSPTTKKTAAGLATTVEPYGASSPRRNISQGSEDDSDEEFYDAERADMVLDGLRSSSEGANDAIDHGEEPCFWTKELDALVQGGVPMALRGEVWQVFMGSSSRRVHGRYQALLSWLRDGGGGLCNRNSLDDQPSDTVGVEKRIKQIEKDLPRTFPGHPALDVDGRTALRHLLTAYACHNPKAGYCQAMNFFAGLLLLVMPEENAFWTLTGILDDCFEGYYSENMLNSQVDQLVLEELVRNHFPRLTTHLDTLGVQVAWISGPWFSSIFVSVLPWESVLRVWDVLLYEGNRSMLFRMTLALLEIYGSVIMTAKDAGDAVTMLQSLASATFDSSQLVLTACVGYQFVTESQLQQLRWKHHPQALAMFSKCLVEQSAWHKTYGPTSFSSNFFDYDETRNAIRDLNLERNSGQSLDDIDDADSFSNNCEGSVKFMKKKAACWSTDIGEDGVLDKGTMLADLVSYMKLELSRALEERRVANLRAEELETALMELVKEDNRRLLSAKVETLEAEVAYLKHALADKVEQDQAMIQVMVRMEHEQTITESALQLAEEDVRAQRSALNAVQTKYESVISSLMKLERRAVAAESMLEATWQYQDVNNGKMATSSKLPSVSAPREEPSRWTWSQNTLKSTNYDNLSPATLKVDATDSNDEMKGNELQHTDPPQSYGLLSRPFSMGWREKRKEKVAVNDTSNRSPSARKGVSDMPH